jgi:hypothetical protein
VTSGDGAGVNASKVLVVVALLLATLCVIVAILSSRGG